MKIGIIGYGFVGKAVAAGFDGNELFIADPKYDTSTADVMDEYPHVIFVCVPTPYGDNGKIDSSIVESIFDELKTTKALVVLKSTVTPDIVARLQKIVFRFVYNPEFLTEANAVKDFLNPTHHVFGGYPYDTSELELIYRKFSKCLPCKGYHTTAVEASFVKYGINSFLAAKVLFMNQFADVVNQHGGNWDSVSRAMMGDPRIGKSHMQVPGPDGRKGYGGACFTKDTAALASFSNGSFSLLEEAIRSNNEIRSQYELDEREIEQNVQYK